MHFAGAGLKPRLWMFDLDGTLVDSIADITAGTNHLLKVLGHGPVNSEQVRGWIGAGARALVSGALGSRATKQEIDRGLELYVEYNHEHIADQSRLFPGVKETLTELERRGLLLAVVTNKNEALCRRALSAFGIETLFSAVVGGDTLPKKKPDPDQIYHVMKEVGMKPGDREAVMVGDSRFDMEAGRAADVVTVACRYGYGEIDENTIDFSIDSFSGLLQLPFAK